MFFVFGPAGQMFRGSSEQLAQVSPVSALRRSQALFSDNAEVLDSPQPPPQSPLPHAAQGPVAAPTAQTQGAVAAYVQTAVGPQPPRQPLSKVRDVMSTDPVSLSPDSVVQAAWQQLAAQHLGQAPVVNVQGQVVGMLLRAHMVPLELWSQLDDVQQHVDRFLEELHAECDQCDRQAEVERGEQPAARVQQSFDQLLEHGRSLAAMAGDAAGPGPG